MNHPAKTIAICFGALILVAMDDAYGQHWHVHDPVARFGHRPHCDIPRLLDLPLGVPCGGFGYGGGLWAAPPAITIHSPIIINTPVLLNAQPLAHRLPMGDGAMAGPLENFAAPAAGVEVADARHDALNEIRRRAAVLKASTAASRARADRSISTGDTAFADQIYGRATAKYREAIARAPDYPAAHFRLAHAYVATRQYNLALNSALIALELSGTSRRDGFSLAEMYRGNKLARASHDERLEDATLREPEDGGLKFLLAFTLHYGGNPLKGRELFRQAERLDGAHQAYIRYFLPVTPVQEAGEAVAVAD